jgi:hypothetical protein
MIAAACSPPQSFMSVNSSPPTSTFCPLLSWLTDARSKFTWVSIKHNANRELPTQKVLDLLKKELPLQYELAEIVGKWIWLDFPAASHRAAANTLYRLGFHWNQRRCVWQHPCGACAPYAAHPKDPRTKYGSYFAADVKPA